MEKEIIIPSNLSEMTLDVNMLINIVQLDENEVSQEYVIAKAFDIPIDVVNAMTQKSVEDLLIKLGKVLNADHAPVYRFKIGDVEYGMIPNMQDTAVKWKEHSDISFHLNAISEEPENVDSYKRFMAVMFRPIIEKKEGLYKIEPYEGSDKYFDIMGKAPAAAFKGAQGFFLTLKKDCLKHFRTCMLNEGSGELQTLVKTLRSTSGGMAVLETLQSLAEKP